MKLPVDTVVGVDEHDITRQMWYFSHHDEDHALFYVFYGQATSLVSKGVHDVFTNIVVMENDTMAHDGSDCPVSSDIIVRITRRNGEQLKGTCDKLEGWFWTPDEISDNDIIAFKILGDVYSQPYLDTNHDLSAKPPARKIEETPQESLALEETPLPKKTLPYHNTKYDKVMIYTAWMWARESSCKRLQVGAVLAVEGRIIMCGYNGTVSGTDNCCEEDPNVPPDQTTTKAGILHAEKNVILFCAKKGISLEGATLYVTHSPCQFCAADIAQSGIVRVVYDQFYRDEMGIKELQRYGVEVYQFV